MDKIYFDGDKITVKIQEDLIGSTAITLKNEVKESLTPNIQEVEIDCSGVNRIDSLGIGFFITTFKIIEKIFRTAKITNVSKEIYDYLHAFQLGKYYIIEKPRLGAQIWQFFIEFCRRKLHCHGFALEVHMLIEDNLASSRRKIRPPANFY